MLKQNKIMKKIIASVKQMLIDDERAYNAHKHPLETKNVWAHVERVIKRAMCIGRQEGANLEILTLAALFHDAGKFRSNKIDSRFEKEEIISARLVEEILSMHDFDPAIINQVKSTIIEPYINFRFSTLEQKVLFDADILDKTGALSLANFVLKHALNGYTIEDMVREKLHVELTYVYNSPKLIQTRTGKRLLRKGRPVALKALMQLYSQLKTIKILDARLLKLKKFNVEFFHLRPRYCYRGHVMHHDTGAEKIATGIIIMTRSWCSTCGEEIKARFWLPKNK